MQTPEEFYQLALQRVERKMGKKGTGEVELDQMAGFFLKRPTIWKGVFALNEPWRTVGGYRIVNLEPRANRGEHWVAVAHNLIYDSFGRDHVVEVREHKAGLPAPRNFSYTDSDAEQRSSEDNCGQRCLAWLMTYDKYGQAGARQI